MFGERGYFLERERESRRNKKEMKNERRRERGGGECKHDACLYTKEMIILVWGVLYMCSLEYKRRKKKTPLPPGYMSPSFLILRAVFFLLAD